MADESRLWAPNFKVIRVENGKKISSICLYKNSTEIVGVLDEAKKKYGISKTALKAMEKLLPIFCLEKSSAE